MGERRREIPGTERNRGDESGRGVYTPERGGAEEGRNRRDCPRGTKDPRCKDPSRLCSLGWLMATRAMVTGDLCAIVRVPPLVHTRLVIGSAHPSLSLSPPSIPYVPTSIDKSISLPCSAGRRSNLLGKYYSKNRKVQTRSKRSEISLSLSLSARRDIVTRTKTCLSVSISRLARFSRVFKNPRSDPGNIWIERYKLLNISRTFSP